ncbi:MAG TPA: ABC transporter permease [Yinghuangia sp.]|nr:ABC transporter permease [Yinghuangia sp.]
MSNPTPQPQPQHRPQAQGQPPAQPQYRPGPAAGPQPETPAGGPGQAQEHAQAHAPGPALAPAYGHPGSPGHPGQPAHHAQPGQPYGAGPAAYGPPGNAQYAPAGHPQAAGQFQQPPNGGLHFTRMLQSEWTKIRTVRSTAWSLVVMVVLILGMAALLGATVSGTDDEPDPSVSLSLIGVMIAQIAAATLGVLTISAEYTTGMIRSTLTAYPRRLTVLAAKSVVFAVLMFVVGLVACYLAYLIGDAMLTRDMVVDSEGKDIFKGVVGCATYLSLLGLFALGVGTILRHSAGAITTVLGVMLLPWIIGAFIPAKAGEWIIEFSPMGLLAAMIAPSGELDSPLGPWSGMLLMAGYAAAALIGAAALLKARDV